MQALRIPGFRPLALNYWLNELADWLATIALAILVYDATRDAWATTAFFVASKFLPALAVPALAARLDQRPIARVLPAAYLVQATGFVVLALTSGSFLLPLVIGLGLVVGTLSATAGALARAATVAVLDPHGRLREGNAILNVGFAVMNAGAPAVAGLLVAALGVGPVLWITVAVFVGLAVVMGTASGLPAAEPEEAPWGARLLEGLRYVAGNPLLRTLLGGQALVILLLQMVTPIEVVYVKESLGAGDAALGFLLGAAGAGMVAGSAIFARSRTSSLTVLVVGPTLAMALGYIGMALAPTLGVACVLAFCVGIGNGIQWVAVVTALQEATDSAFQARLAGVMEAVITAAPGVGFLLGGATTALLSPRAAFAVSGGGVLCVVVISGLIVATSRSLRARTPAPAAAGEAA